MRLGHYGGSRDNNFNLIRFVAATLVLVSHSYVLSTGTGNAEPLRLSLGVTWGSIAVDIFFVASGFLVTGSLLNRGNLYDFAASRCLRIYPGLWVALALTVAVAGLWVTTLPAVDFFRNPETWKHLFRNATLVTTAHYKLPGVFENLPAQHTVNGSLWTLPWEVRMYLSLALAWLVATRLLKSTALGFAAICGIIALSCLLLGLKAGLSGKPNYLLVLGFMFFAGAVLRLFQDRVPASTTIAALLFAAVLLSSAYRPAFGIAYTVCLPYLVIYAALVPRGALRRFNKFGDYSYGIYIYAFPVQQLLVFLNPGIEPWTLTLRAFPIVLALAITSWHLVEKRALALKLRLTLRPAPAG